MSLRKLNKERANKLVDQHVGYNGLGQEKRRVLHPTKGWRYYTAAQRTEPRFTLAEVIHKVLARKKK